MGNRKKCEIAKLISLTILLLNNNPHIYYVAFADKVFDIMLKYNNQLCGTHRKRNYECGWNVAIVVVCLVAAWPHGKRINSALGKHSHTRDVHSLYFGGKITWSVDVYRSKLKHITSRNILQNYINQKQTLRWSHTGF